MTGSLTLVVPGDVDTRTGGYEYDRRIVDALRRRGWVVEVREVQEGFPYPTQPARAEVARALRERADGELVLIDGLALGVFPDEVLAEARRLRIVALVHHPLALETGLDADTAAVLSSSERRALGGARRVVVTSEATARTLEGYGVDASSVHVVVPGTDPAPLATGSGSSTIRLLCVATLVPRKGHDVLVRALVSLRDLPWELVCGGSLERAPATVSAVVTQVRDAGLKSRVQFVGELTESKLAEQYDRADVFVLPTLYEGYGMVVAEAVARGLPVIASDTGGVADVLGEGAGIVVPPGESNLLADALRTMIAEPETRAAFAAGARKARTRLATWGQQAAAMEAVLLGIPAS